ncbi:MAG: colicin V synthesis protein [Sulfurimonas sp.]|nr:MAG: colicin V synthesis protein [Sulfurimonas sp.]
MDLNYFDLVASIIILFLGLKGIINGFFKELFGLLGIVGGIFVASRVGDTVGQKASDLIFKFENSAAVSFTGFLMTLAVFWLLMLVAGYAFKKLSALSGLGVMDKILGFVFGASKFFLIASVIAYSAYNIKAVRSSIDTTMNNSIIFPIMANTGSFIMKLDPVDITKEINNSVEEISKAVQDTVENTIKSSAQEIVDKTKKELQKQISNEEKNNHA